MGMLGVILFAILMIFVVDLIIKYGKITETKSDSDRNLAGNMKADKSSLKYVIPTRCTAEARTWQTDYG